MLILLLEILKRYWVYVLLLSFICLLYFQDVFLRSQINKLQNQLATCNVKLNIQNMGILQQAKTQQQAYNKAQQAKEESIRYHQEEMPKAKEVMNKQIGTTCNDTIKFLVDYSSNFK